MTAHMQGNWCLVDIEHVMEALKGIRQRVEVLARADVVCGQGFHDLIARCPKDLLVKDHREICIVRLDILLDGIELQAVDITEALAKAGGTVELEVKVTNLWPNRLMLDAGLPSSERITRTNHNPWKPTDSPLPSGLKGPVRVLWQERP